MFDIGFSELLVIAIVALIVIGPQRLPQVARTLGHLFGRMQRYVNDVKADIAREIELEELKKMQSSIEDTAHTLRDSFTREVSDTESELNKLAQTAQPAPEPYPDPAPEASAPPVQPASPQLDLALDSPPRPPAQKQA